MHTRLEDIIAKINELVTNSGYATVAVDGFGAAGKTYLAEELAKNFPKSIIIPVSDFYRPTKQRVTSSYRSVTDENFDWQRLNTEVLTKLQEHQPIRYQRYDPVKDELTEWFSTAEPQVVILEGPYILQSRFRKYFDLKVWVDTPVGVRIVRARNKNQNAFHDWLIHLLPKEDYYVAHEKPEQAADFIVQGY